MGQYVYVTKPLHTVAETPIYLSRAEKLMSENEREAIVELLAASSEIGDLIPETGVFARSGFPWPVGESAAGRESSITITM